MKKCIKCGVLKPLDMFCIDRSAKDGRCCTCKLCRNAYRKTWDDANREYKNIKAKDYYKDNAFYINKRTSEHARDLVNSGLCDKGCGNPIDYDRSTCRCTECLNKRNFYDKRYREEGVLWK